MGCYTALHTGAPYFRAVTLALGALRTGFPSVHLSLRA